MFWQALPFLCSRLPFLWSRALGPFRDVPWSLLLFFFALLQLLGRSAADIVREDTDREMATFLMFPLVPPESGVQTLFFEFDATLYTVAPA